MIRCIGPKRLIDLIKVSKLLNTKIEFPDVSVNNNAIRTKNNEAVVAADSLICLFDEPFFELGKSIGTKVEITNYSDKIMLYLYYDKDQFWVRQKPMIKDIVPSVTDYLNSEVVK